VARRGLATFWLSLSSLFLFFERYSLPFYSSEALAEEGFSIYLIRIPHLSNLVKNLFPLALSIFNILAENRELVKGQKPL
jgi:hypothetical protein